MHQSIQPTIASNPPEKGSHRVTNLKLYGHWRSSSTWRVQVALTAKNIPFQFYSIDILSGEPKGVKYATNVNAMKQIPVLECIDTSIVIRDPDNENDDHSRIIRITQSLAIIEFIEEAFPNNGSSQSLLPSNLVDRARVREIAEIVNSGIQPLQNLSVMDKIDGFGEGLVEIPLGNGKKFGKYHIENGLKAIERLVVNARKTNNDPKGHYAIGSSHPTLADACIIPQMYNARRFNVNLEETCPTLLEIESFALKHHWFSTTHPDVIRQKGVIYSKSV